MPVINLRRAIGTELIPYFEEDYRLTLLVCDMGFGVLDALRENFPDRVINCGIMEQCTVGMAAGMRMAGLRPVVYSIVSFLVFRALEQIRNDVVCQGLDVKFIGTGANECFKKLGRSHYCDQDDRKIYEVIGLPVYDPYTSDKAFPEMVKEWIMPGSPAYIRV
jgi:transketolase